MSAGHASPEWIDAYARGGTGLAADEVWAVEAHLETCGECRGRLTRAVGTGAPEVVALVDTVWAGLEPELAATAAVPRPKWWRTGLSARLSGWLTPAMVPWLAMAVGVTLAALLLDFAVGTDADAVPPVLLVAPVLPVLGVAASWSRALDPAYELTVSTPRAGLPLVLRRTASVLAAVVPALLLCGWLTGVMVAQWLLPCLALTSTTLALGSVIGVTRAAVSLTTLWTVLVAVPALVEGHTTFALRAGGLPVWGLLLALGTGVVIARRNAYSVLGAHR